MSNSVTNKWSRAIGLRSNSRFQIERITKGLREPSQIIHICTTRFREVYGYRIQVVRNNTTCGHTYKKYMRRTKLGFSCLNACCQAERSNRTESEDVDPESTVGIWSDFKWNIKREHTSYVVLERATRLKK